MPPPPSRAAGLFAVNPQSGTNPNALEVINSGASLESLHPVPGRFHPRLAALQPLPDRITGRLVRQARAPRPRLAGSGID